jgi:hypothetical protein
MAVLSLSLGGAAWLFEEQATASVQAVVQLWESTGVRR